MSIYKPIKPNIMNTLSAVVDLAEKLLAEEFVFSANENKFCISAKKIGFKFHFNNSKTSFGICSHSKQIIYLSLPLCKENLDKVESEIKNVVLHEIAHAFSSYAYGIDGRGHGANWRRIAKQIGNNGDICYSEKNVNPAISKYSLVCDNCGTIIPKYRKPTKTKACAKCCNEHNNGKFSHVYILRLVENDI